MAVLMQAAHRDEEISRFHVPRVVGDPAHLDAAIAFKRCAWYARGEVGQLHPEGSIIGE
jgi:hypothetical protein